MHELRKDPIVSRWVIVLKDSLGPQAYRSEDGQPAHEAEQCPICSVFPDPPRLLLHSPVAGDEGWNIKVHKSPVELLEEGEGLNRKGRGMYDVMGALGVDEVIIESPGHDTHSEDLGGQHMGRIFEAQRQRVEALERDERIRYVMVSKNSVTHRGGVFDHPSSRIVAAPVIPLRVKVELDGAKEYYSYKERCVFCDILHEELRIGSRIIRQSEHFVAFSPFAPRYSFEFWVMPRRHACAFKDMTPEETADLGHMMAWALGRFKAVFGGPSYSYVVHNSPNRIPRRNYWHTLGDDYHWHITVMPRLRKFTGLEWSSGLYAVETSPEDAARYLREE